MFHNKVYLFNGIFKSVVLIAWLLVCFCFFAVLQNDHFLQLLVTDNVETAVIMMSVLHSILGVNRLVDFIITDFLKFKYKTQFVIAL